MATDPSRGVLYLVRHGDAKSKMEDPARSLSDRGRREVERVAAWAAAAGVKVERIGHSGKRRAEETAAILATHLRPEETQRLSGLDPNDDVEPVAELLEEDDRSTMLVGHLPFLSRLASKLITGDEDAEIVIFRPAALAELRLSYGRWVLTTVVQPERIR